MKEKIINIISEVLSVAVNENTSQATCEKWDSLQHLNIVVALEEEFNLSFEPEEIALMKDIDIIEQMINQKSHDPI